MLVIISLPNSGVLCPHTFLGKGLSDVKVTVILERALLFEENETRSVLRLLHRISDKRYRITIPASVVNITGGESTWGIFMS